MLPDKSGYWWWEDIEGKIHGVLVRVIDVNDIYCYHMREDKWLSRTSIESKKDFRKWVSIANPPKRINRYSIVIRDEYLYVKAIAEPNNEGLFSKFNDVKEYSLK